MMNKQLEVMTQLSTPVLKELEATTLELIKKDEGNFDSHIEQLHLIRQAKIMRGIA